MFSNCANPDCRAEFVCGEGRFFRFHRAYPANEQAPNTHSVQHLWLCGKCSNEYTLDYREGAGVAIRRNPEVSNEPEILRLVSTA